MFKHNLVFSSNQYQSILIIVENEKVSVRRAQSAVICNKSTNDWARFFPKMNPVSTRLCCACNSSAGAIDGNAKSTRQFRGRNRL